MSAGFYILMGFVLLGLAGIMGLLISICDRLDDLRGWLKMIYEDYV